MHRADSIYDDRPSEQYQFPSQYLSRAEASVGDWIVYLEPTKVKNSRGYFGVARVQQIVADPSAERMFVAIIAPGSYLEFPSPVPFSHANEPIERGLLNSSGRLSGRAQSAVRPISNLDFTSIVNAGLQDDEQWPDRVDSLEYRDDEFVYPDLSDQAQATYERPIVETLINRKVRDEKFRLLVRRAYDRRCAFTGLRLINGKGRPEVEAAHIRPVANNGPDSIRNGIALSGTVHWMFDRGMLTLDDDYKIRVSRQLNYDVSNLLNRDLKAILPADPRLQPHPDFLGWHRDNIFKH